MEEKKDTVRKTAVKKVPVHNDMTEEEQLNLDAKVTVTNLSSSILGFPRRHDGFGDVTIAANGQQRLTRNEIQAQVNNGNNLFTGTDGQGSHAVIYIEDAATRRWLGFDDEDRKQFVFTDETAKELFEMTYESFKAKLPEYVKSPLEKRALIDAIKKLEFNDYKKIVYATNYAGFKL